MTIPLDKIMGIVYNIYNKEVSLRNGFNRNLKRQEKKTMGKTKLFISHSSQDAKVVTAFVNFMLTIGLRVKI